jgi:nitrogen fixation-related uncharacterized protein
MNDEEKEAKKSLFLKIGVSVVITIVFFLWAANLKGVFESDKKQNRDRLFENISSDIDKQMKGLEQKMNENQNNAIKNDFVKELITKTDEVAYSSTSTPAAEIKKELINLTKSTTTNLRVSCPSFINCMPTIGENKPCAVPAGCENITQIAY